MERRVHSTDFAAREEEPAACAPGANPWSEIIGSMPDFPDPEPVAAIDPVARLRRNPADGYDSLRVVLGLALEQAAAGKGKERHALAGQRFEDQEIVQENARMGTTAFGVGQARKKALESMRLPREAAERELLGAINYLAGAYLALGKIT